MTPDETVTVKGSPVRSLQKFIENNLTAEQREAAYRHLPAEYVAKFKSPILPTETLPVHMLNRITEEAAKAKGEEMEAFAKRAGRAGADEAMKGIYRFFAMVLTPTALLSRASQMWSSIYNRGELRVESQTAGSATLRLLNFPSERSGCARLTGWIEQMASLTGVKVVKIEQTECYAKGAPHCEWELRWQ